MRQSRVKYLLLLPALIWVLSFVIYPLIDSLSVSLYNYQLGLGRTAFVGFGNYLDSLRSEEFWQALTVTLKLNALVVPTEIILGFFIAWVLNRKVRAYPNLFRGILVSPIFTTFVAIGYLGITLFHETGGPVNYFLGFFGLHVDWLSSSRGAFFSVALLDIWRWTPFVFIISLAGLESIPDSYYEIISLDTSSDIQMLRYITLPVFLPTLLLVLLLRLMEGLKMFGIAMTLTGGGPGIATQVYTLLVYRKTIKFFDFGHGAALGYIFLLIAMIVIIPLFTSLRKRFGE